MIFIIDFDEIKGKGSYPNPDSIDTSESEEKKLLYLNLTLSLFIQLLELAMIQKQLANNLL